MTTFSNRRFVGGLAKTERAGFEIVLVAKLLLFLEDPLVKLLDFKNNATHEIFRY